MTAPTQGADAPTFSVVIPTGGGRWAWLNQCITSVHDNLLPGETIEVIVVLDGAKHPKMIENSVYDRPVTFISTERAGPATARNIGWRRASGEVIAFLDDDVIVELNWLDDLRRWFMAHPDAGGVGGRVDPVHASNPVSRMMTDQIHLEHQKGDHGWRLITANAAFRRSALEAVGGFDQNFLLAGGEDFDLCDRLGEAGYEVAMTRSARVVHRHPTTIADMRLRAHRYRVGNLMGGKETASLAAGSEDETASEADFESEFEDFDFDDPEATNRSTALPLTWKVRKRIWEQQCRVADKLHASSLPHWMVDTCEVAAFAVPSIGRMPGWYRRARRSPARPSVPMSAAEACLEMLWHIENVKPLRPTDH
ncbi:MAG: glycosyltransferase [Actinobacteria bacterium]|uniref:Unannotated protein n=1 Tax=freshwater metagenome TaxID=449393 RepID=A0A6J5Y8U9_9ZZZZ|nr:glycosyltransferase [Actinomycetota bacterium]MTA76917.1 glycosyltransferase [Actinomycetota bacterium]